MQTGQQNKCHKDIIMATAEYIDNDLRLLDSMDDLEFTLQKNYYYY